MAWTESGALGQGVVTSLWVAVGVAISGPAPARAQQPSAAPPLVFDGATVIDVTDGKVLPDQRVVIVGSRVQAMGPAGQIQLPPPARVVDAKGKYLVPGFWDMHVHVDDKADDLYPPFIAYGVTGIREMAQRLFADGADYFRARQREVMAGTRVGPRGIGPSADVSVGNDIELGSPEDAVRIVDSLKAAGDALIKFHGDPDDAAIYFALLREGRRVGIPIVGHLPPSVGAIAAADSGVSSIEHLVGYDRRCTFWWPLNNEVTPSVIDTVGPNRTRADRDAGCRQLAQALIRNGTWVDPTLSIYRYKWGHYLLNGLDFVRRLHEAGFQNFLAGTDYGYGGPTYSQPMPTKGPWVFGTIATEIQLFVQAGLTPLEALQTATLNPAKYLKVTDSLGTVAPGKLADLVLLDGNPLADISHVRHVHAVVANGRYFDRAALDSLDPRGLPVRRLADYFDHLLALERRPAPAAQPVAFQNVTVVDVTDGRRLSQQTVVVADARIQAMGPAGKVPLPAGAQVVEAKGKYLIPGLWDMHVELDDPLFERDLRHQDSIYQAFYPRFIAHGVTGIREMAQHFAHGSDSVRAWQRAIAAGARVGPRLIGPSSALNYYGPNIVDMQWFGANLLKGDLSQKFTGTELDSAAAAVVDSLKAAGDAFIYSDASRDRMTPEVYFALLRQARRAGLPVIARVPQEVSEVEAADSGQRSIEHVEDHHQCWPVPADSAEADQRCAPAAQAYVRNGTWIVPTLTWAGYGEHNVPDAQRLVRVLHRLGVKTLLAGSGFTLERLAQAPAFLPGRSVAEEVVLLAGAGLTPLEALQAATLNPAKYANATDALGTVAAGKAADLVLLDGDPLADVHNVTKVWGVVANGRYFDRAALNALDPDVALPATAPVAAALPDRPAKGGSP